MYSKLQFTELDIEKYYKNQNEARNFFFQHFNLQSTQMLKSVATRNKVGNVLKTDKFRLFVIDLYSNKVPFSMQFTLIIKLPIARERFKEARININK